MCDVAKIKLKNKKKMKPMPVGNKSDSYIHGQTIVFTVVSFYLSFPECPVPGIMAGVS